MAKVTDADIKAHAEKHGISEDAVREILGVAPDAGFSLSASTDKKNPSKVKVTIDPPHDGTVFVDQGDGNGNAEHEAKKGVVTLRYGSPGHYRVRVDVDAVVRWVDVDAGADTEPEPEPEPEKTDEGTGESQEPEQPEQ